MMHLITYQTKAYSAQCDIAISLDCNPETRPHGVRPKARTANG